MTSKFKYPRPEPQSRLEAWLSLAALVLFVVASIAVLIAYLAAVKP